ncbi:hypothetical protein FB567DRAFT_196667 [Paraphoma chrysanthemicola]|uniref:Uncharacterized protein n=1 Tax=Paraphoma chrysanthemicola TaxID=798071 RepID=A0A8K0VTX6_9PLEO|nr:hypothetical protein FB567DRAFT_196667 [Paraphoma chrysanthemicola]
MAYLLHLGICALAWYIMHMSCAVESFVTTDIFDGHMANRTDGVVISKSAHLNMSATVATYGLTHEEAYKLAAVTDAAILTSQKLVKYLLRDQVIMGVLVTMVLILGEVVLQYRAAAKRAAAASSTEKHQRKVRFELP